MTTDMFHLSPFPNSWLFFGIKQKKHDEFHKYNRKWSPFRSTWNNPLFNRLSVAQSSQVSVWYIVGHCLWFYPFFLSLHCLSFIKFRLMITCLVSLSFSYFGVGVFVTLEIQHYTFMCIHFKQKCTKQILWDKIRNLFYLCHRFKYLKQETVAIFKAVPKPIGPIAFNCTPRLRDPTLELCTLGCLSTHNDHTS